MSYPLPNKNQTTQFRGLLLAWNKQENKRKMPWKGEKEPYKIWLSEVILQQTRVEQGLDYYERFIKKYPTIHDLALAKDEAVFKLWEGLGYYSRCRNLLAAARFISFEKGGRFPNNYKDILSLKGVGPYTAAAIASFAYQLPHAVVDGNVIRVIARFFGITVATDTTEGKKIFTTLAELLLDKNAPHIYNQAIMDFGATVCKPLSPSCLSCPLEKKCVAFQEKKINELPRKKKKISITKRWFYYFILRCNDKIFIQQREAKDIWNHLHEFYLLESNQAIKWTNKKAIAWVAKEFSIKNPVVKYISAERKQQLTHQQINGVFIEVHIDKIPQSLPANCWLSAKKINKLAFPRFITSFLAEKKLTLSNT
ncbi:MAG: A/G-specific adenine glycosylase [Chitinophagaceae bacterium]|nr:A/G-specific adenine glycosylase [Chitinophagaceae bacterium]